MRVDGEAIGKLLGLRRLRERQAETVLGLAVVRAAESERALERSRQALHACREHRPAREQRLFDELVASAGAPRALERYRHAASALMREEERLGARVEAAESERSEAVETLASARNAHAIAVRQSEKFAAIAEQRRTEARCLAERADEQENEEWCGAAPDRPELS